MTVTSFSEGDLFVFRVVKYLSTNPANKWANSYEFQATAAGDSVTLNLLASILVLYERDLHHNVVKFDHVLVSTWEVDSVPYDPSTFLSIPQTAEGGVGPVADLLPLDKALSVARVPTSGRFGHIFYRGVLGEDEVEAPAGKSVFTSFSEVNGRVMSAVTENELDAYLGNPASAPMQMVMVDKTGSIVRNVTALTALGVSTIPTDHKWFNRTTPGGPG
jgi:hypothetical protein